MSSILSPLQPGAMLGEASSANSLSPAPRPNFIRRETDQILSYYQSEHAGRSFDQYATAAPDCEPPSQIPPPNAHSHPHPLPHTTHQLSAPSSDSDYAEHVVRPLQPALVESARDLDLKLAFPPTATDPRSRAHLRQGSTFSSGSDYSSHYSDSEEGAPLATPVATSSQFHVPTPRAGAEREARSHKPTHGHGDAARHSRRPSVPTEGGADRRRLAIVEMDPPAVALSVGRKRSKGLDGKSLIDPSASSSAMGGGTLFSRRGVHIGGLALMAPPDASPKTYTNLTPPSTAPVSSGTPHIPPSAFAPSHSRSASEAVNSGGSRSRLHHKSSRDVGIVGLSSASTASESLGPASPTSDEYQVYAHTEGLGVPLFQTPAKSRSPSPGVATPELSDTSSGSAFRSPHQRLLSTPIFGMEDGIVTPGIGEGKDIRQPVVGPVIVGISPELLHGSQGATNVSAATRGYPSVQSPTSSSPSYHTSSSSTHYLHYQPGVHATAGPLPPPPRSLFDRDTAPPPRPPRHQTPLTPGARRDIDAIKEALQLPQSVSAKLAARTPPDSDKRLGREPSPPPTDSKEETRSQESAYSEESAEPSIKLVTAKPVHVREGAFPPSKIITSPPGSHISHPASATSPELPLPRSDARPVVVIEQDETEDEYHETGRRPALELRRESSWVSLSQEMQRDTSPNGKAISPPNLSVSRTPSSISEASSSSSVSHLPSLPPKSIRHGSDEDKHSSSLAPSAFRALTNLKRFSSLPRTPSRSSKSSKRSPSPDAARRSMSPPPPPILVQSPPRRRVIPKPKYAHPWPPAMNPADVVVLRGSRERAQAYAMKINELSMYDCGLREWLAAQGRGPAVSHPRTQSQRTAHQVMHSLPPEFGGMAGQSRHVSHGSMASQMTFPIRADAYTATDLSTRPGDAPTTAPPAILPYPSLAQAQAQRAPARSSTLLLSPTKSLQIPLPLPGTKGSGTGFFASLGRKTSVRKDKGGLLSASPQSPTKVLTKSRPPVIAATQSNPQPSRPAPFPAAPSIPGGPRAAPGRIQRAKTFSVGPSIPDSSTPPPETSRASPPQAESSSSHGHSQRQSAAPARRPSLFARARQGHSSVVPAGSRPMPVASADPNFQRQVDKLADLLPHADRTILAGYLRRAGEDILAIGQYLEDEKNGTLRRD
ncbi:hypothetical protein L227DRAFT_652141, partial [Lentinus tigrinus ALCF2SS1-6]